MAANVISVFILAICWGGAAIFLRIAVPAFGAVPLIFLRMVVTAAVLAPALASAQARTDLRRNGRTLAIAALVSDVVPYVLVAEAAKSVGVGQLTLIISLVPVSTAIWGLHFRQPILRRQWLGLFVGVLGIAALTRATAGRPGDGGVGGIGCALIGVLTFGYATNFAKARLAHLNPNVTVLGMALVASGLLLVPALCSWPWGQSPPLRAWAAAFALGAASTALPYVLFFWLLKRVSVIFATAQNFIAPAVGVAGGILFLGETSDSNLFAAGGLIVGALMLTLWPPAKAIAIEAHP